MTSASLTSRTGVGKGNTNLRLSCFRTVTTVTAGQKIDFMRSNPASVNLNAVLNDRFVVLEYVEATPGPRNIAAIAELAAAFHGN